MSNLAREIGDLCQVACIHVHYLEGYSQPGRIYRLPGKGDCGEIVQVEAQCVSLRGRYLDTTCADTTRLAATVGS